MSTAALDLTSLVLSGTAGVKYRADVLAAVKSLKVRQTITGASTVDITLSDPRRTLLRSPLFNARTAVVIGGSAYELCAVQKTGNDLAVTFEDTAIAALRLKKGARAVAAGTMSRAQFCTTLIREVPWIKVAAAKGPKSLVQLARGSGSTSTTTESVLGGWGNFGSTSTKPAKTAATTTTKAAGSDKANDEDTWTAVGRIMGEIGWRSCVIGGAVYLAPDSWLMSHAKSTYTLSETSPGVDNIDLDYDIGKPAATASMTVWAGYTSLTVGSPVTLANMGAGNGRWLVETIERSVHSKQADVTLVRQQPTLPEPVDTAGAAANGALGEGGWGDFTLPDLSSLFSSSGEAGSSAQFVLYAQTASGKPYVWGASGPNSFDCSGLVQWAAKKVGVDLPKPVASQTARMSRISVEQAIGIKGAFLYRGTPGVHGPNDHIAISLGNGYTIEARGKAWGCGTWPARGRGWTGGGIHPLLRPTTSTRDLRGG